jgi:2-polyprenyl-6-hydroxyphenyl methylase/3-demethylubiquinone-9 3-methyltransferase
VDQSRIDEAKRSLQEMLDVDSLAGKSFLDIGSGSGLFSLAATLMGASVRSFDFDPQSVACTKTLRDRFSYDHTMWIVEEASVLDREYLETLGQFDVVYSWGVLHHTGAMWKAIRNAASLVAPNGSFFIAIYNDQGFKSRVWKLVKRLYCSSSFGKFALSGVVLPYFMLRAFAADVLRGRNPASRYANYKHHSRGMSLVHDWIDWLGGYPFEVARPDDVRAFCVQFGLTLKRAKDIGVGWGCNEFVFRRSLDS